KHDVKAGGRAEPLKEKGEVVVCSKRKHRFSAQSARVSAAFTSEAGDGMSRIGHRIGKGGTERSGGKVCQSPHLVDRLVARSACYQHPHQRTLRIFLGGRKLLCIPQGALDRL